MTLRFGRDVRLGRHMNIEVWAQGDNLLEIGDQGAFQDGVRIVLRSGSMRFGPKCLVRDGVWIKSDGQLTTGEEVTLNRHASVHCAKKIDLEDLVGTGERVSIVDSDHTFDGADSHYMGKPLHVSPVRIGRNAMLAIGAVILRGSDIGRNSVVAANAVVRGGEYPPGSVIAGNPASVIKTLGPTSEPSGVPSSDGASGAPTSV